MEKFFSARTLLIILEKEGPVLSGNTGIDRLWLNRIVDLLVLDGSHLELLVVVLVQETRSRKMKFCECGSSISQLGLAYCQIT